MYSGHFLSGVKFGGYTIHIWTSAPFAPLYVTLSTRPCVRSASAASLKSESLVAAPVRAMMLTSVGGSVKLWRRPTMTGPLPAIAS
jgi:hypothetical protein